MFNLLIATDSFKGSASSLLIAEILEKNISSLYMGEIRIEKIPLADGGEGSLESINQVLNLEKVYRKVNDPLMREIKTFYLFDKVHSAAYIEMAKASGLGFVSSNNDIMKASSFGTGQLLKHAISEGARKIVLFLGGSATCDAGMGICQALSIDFYNSNHEKIFPFPDKLCEISKIDFSSSLLNNKDIEIILSIDVNNPFYGINGASYTYSPQKGANPQQVKKLDEGLQHIAGIICSLTGIDLQKINGTGAAGGAAGGMLALLGAKMENGSEFIFRMLGLEERIKQADLIISGEGKIDQQSLNQKLLYSLSRLTARYNKALWAVCGIFDGDSDLLNQLFIEKVFPLVVSKDEIADSMKNIEAKLEQKTHEIVAALKENYPEKINGV